MDVKIEGKYLRALEGKVKESELEGECFNI